MTKYAYGHQVIGELHKLAPKHLAYEGDPIGLQVGNLALPVEKVMVVLDVLEPVVDEAIAKGVQLIIAHHPMIYRPLKNIDTATSQGRMIEKLLRHNITVYAAHTNLDIAKGGVNDWLAEALHLEQTSLLQVTAKETLYKLAVYVPTTHVEEVKEALAAAGAGHIGDYSHCTFSSEGTGTFKPLEGSQPFLGSQGDIEHVREVKLETVLPSNRLSRVLSAMHNVHPYEEVAYDVYELQNEHKTYGIGIVGTLHEALSFDAFIQHVKGTLGVASLRAVKGHDRLIKKVAVVGGDGNKFIHAALAKGADVLVTGDLYYHTAHDAQYAGLSVVDPGHHIEKIMKPRLCEYLQKALAGHYATEVMASTQSTDPFTFH
ncbi:hypothetical protein A374_10660 [Fictibacillus macauensis ZFHKF-1]|uniref:GTP cyclohydrolase 1 type 2 homolog n=1 Tax=Fictibacillus macauensis ZFHKF-1 TaxID=1196324 RepID=I8UEG1_9BACL|nr:Nif3-like dinuclear metal center hexameric protein [Fictibacillus macauensis]EIT85198.1 hypothetical protein A374_10660 [Fictibacillus macauensis ZFHKF-1]